MAIDKIFKKLIYILMIIGYVATLCLFVAAIITRNFEFNILFVIRWTVFIFLPVLLNDTGIKNTTKQSSERKVGSLKINRLALIYLLITSILLFSSAYVFFILETLNYMQGVGSIASLIGACAIMKAIFSAQCV